MNHYDDLQRFQEKTRTQNLNFQDLSSQAATREHGDWAILNQLNPGAEKPSSLALGGSVSAPLPQSVPADLFRQVEAAIAAAPTSDPVCLPLRPRLLLPSRSWRPPQPHRSRSGRSLRRPLRLQFRRRNRPWRRRREWPPDPRPPPRTMPTCSPRKARSRWRKIKTSL